MRNEKVFFSLFQDFKKGFGGTFGVDERAKDKSAVGFDYKAPVEKHSSQTGRKEKKREEKGQTKLFSSIS